MPDMNEDKEPGLHHKMMKRTGKFFDDFRQFAVRGNAVDLAVGVVIGAAFGKIITSLVSDIITPPISLLLGHVNFASLFINISGVPYATLEEAKKAGAATINYGAFLSAILDFVLITLIIFMVVKTLSRMRRETPPPVDMRDCPSCISPVKKQATRCPFCTSELKPQPAEIKSGS